MKLSGWYFFADFALPSSCFELLPHWEAEVGLFDDDLHVVAGLPDFCTAH